MKPQQFFSHPLSRVPAANTAVQKGGGLFAGFPLALEQSWATACAGMTHTPLFYLAKMLPKL